MIVYYKFFDYLRKHNLMQKDLIDAKVLSTGTMNRLRKNEFVNTAVLDAICTYLHCDLTDIMEYKSQDTE